MFMGVCRKPNRVPLVSRKLNSHQPISYEIGHQSRTSLVCKLVRDSFPKVQLSDNDNGTETLKGDHGDRFLNEFVEFTSKTCPHDLMQPRRTYVGFRYNDGYSDHLPLVARFRLQNISTGTGKE